MKIIGKDLYNVLLNYKKHIDAMGLPKDELLNGIIEDWRSPLPTSWRDAEQHLKSCNVEWELVKVGDKIRIVKMYDKNGTDTAAAEYNGREGVVEYIDSMGQYHGTWGGLAVIPEVDVIEKIG